MTYKPVRDSRFEYVFEAMAHVEDRHCQDCKFAEPGEFPMCIEVSSLFMMEEPVPQIDDLGNDGLFCNKKEVM